MKQNTEPLYIYKALDIKYKFYDCNPNNTKKYSASACNDCSVRTLCKITGKSWYEVFNDLITTGITLKSMPDSIKVIHKVYASNGLKLLKVKGTVGAFMAKHKTGAYAIMIEHHMFAYIDGVIYDSVDGIPLKDEDIEYLTIAMITRIYSEEK